MCYLVSIIFANIVNLGDVETAESRTLSGTTPGPLDLRLTSSVKLFVYKNIQVVFTQ